MASAQTSAKFAIGWIGALAVAFAVGAIIVAVAANPSWQIDVNPICDLGVGESSLTYTIGMAIAGILLAVFGAGRAAFGKNYHAEASIITAALGICIVLLSYFTIDYKDGDFHNYLTYIAMLFFAVAAIVHSYQYWFDGGARRITAGVGIIALTVCIAALLSMSFDVFTNVVVIAGLVWFAADATTYVYGNINSLKVKE